VSLSSFTFTTRALSLRRARMDNVITVRQVCEFMRTAQNRDGIIFTPILAKDLVENDFDIEESTEAVYGSESPMEVVGYFIPKEFHWNKT
jgi:hypothetical protein